eukprot:961164-Pleurochrysis_carterae.AAC.2
MGGDAMRRIKSYGCAKMYLSRPWIQSMFLARWRITERFQRAGHTFCNLHSLRKFHRSHSPSRALKGTAARPAIPTEVGLAASEGRHRAPLARGESPQDG